MSGPPGPDARRRIAVAVVDDELIVRVAMRRLCEAVGLSVTVFGSGREFLSSLDLGGPRPDCLLLDAQMPEMTGLEVQRHLASLGVRLPTIVFTADDAPEVRARHDAAGASWYLRKPITDDELLTAIDRALGR